MSVSASSSRVIIATGIVKDHISSFLEEASKIIEKNIKAELRSPNKTGTAVGDFSYSQGRKFKRFSKNRSAVGESLARETGKSERLISSTRVGSRAMEIGFLDNPNGFDYVAYHEEDNSRPTLKNAVDKSLKEIEAIIDKNFMPK